MADDDDHYNTLTLEGNAIAVLLKPVMTEDNKFSGDVGFTLLEPVKSTLAEDDQRDLQYMGKLCIAAIKVMAYDANLKNRLENTIKEQEREKAYKDAILRKKDNVLYLDFGTECAGNA